MVWFCRSITQPATICCSSPDSEINTIIATIIALYIYGMAKISLCGGLCRRCKDYTQLYFDDQNGKNAIDETLKRKILDEK